MAEKPDSEELEQRVEKSMKQTSKSKPIQQGIRKNRDVEILRNPDLGDAALRESEERYRSLVESTEDSIYLVDRNCRYLFMNKKHLSRLDPKKDKVMGSPYSRFHSKNDTKEFNDKIEEVFRSGISIQQEYRSRIDDRSFLRTLSPVKKPDGRISSVTVISKDITTY